MKAKQTTYSAVLGVVLANLRAEKQLEQGELANRMGLSQASYSRLESGKATFSVDQMYHAASALELTGEDLTKRVNTMISVLQQNGTQVVPQVRGNTLRAKAKESGEVSFVVGAALGALLIGLLSKKK